MKGTTALLTAALVVLGGLTACSSGSSSEPYKVTVASNATPSSEVVEEEFVSGPIYSHELLDMWDRFSPAEKQVFCADFNSAGTQASIIQQAGGAANVEEAMRFFRSVC